MTIQVDVDTLGNAKEEADLRERLRLDKIVKEI